MQPASSLTEDLPMLAAEAVEVSRRFCGDCQNFHFLWPYLRLAKASGGGGVGSRLIHAALGRLLPASGGEILIAGAADTGLLSVLARGVPSGTRICVLDRCETPLELCRRFARRQSLPLETMHVDLMEFATTNRFDVVFAHSILQFIPGGRRVDVLARLARSLRPTGRLMLVFRTSSRLEGSLLDEYRETYAGQLIKQIEAAGVALPESREDFFRRAQDYGEERRMREGAHLDREDVEAMLHSAGFEIEEMNVVEADLAVPFRAITDKIRKRRFLAIGRPVQ